MTVTLKSSPSSAPMEWDRPVRNLSEALKKISSNAQTLQFEHRMDPYSDGEIDFRRAAGDKIANPHIGDDGVFEICKALKTNKTLRGLDLSGNKISTNGIQALCDLIAANKSIEVLYLEDNQIGDEDLQFIAEVLKHNTTLKQLCLSGNKITSKGAKALAKSLKKNEALQALWLNRNEIRDDGAKAFAKTLKKKNKVLDTLCLEDNRIREDGAKSLAKTLKKNTDLRTLNLANNKINHKGAKYFDKAIKSNFEKGASKKGKSEGLECLILDGNRMNHEDLEVLKNRAASRQIEIQNRPLADHKPKEKGKVRVANFMKYRWGNAKLMKKGRFKEDHEIKREL